MTLGVFGAGVVAASDAPAWMRSQLNVPLPAHDEKTEAVVLYADTTLTVQPNGKVKRLYREVLRILRPDGEARGTVTVYFGPLSRITILQGWCIPGSGKEYQVKEKDAVESAVVGVEGAELINDIRTKTLRIPAATVGSVVGYEIEQELRPYVDLDEWQFQDTIPVREAHYTLQLPRGWSYNSSWLNQTGGHVTEGPAGQWHWSVSDVPAVRIERNMPPWRGLAGTMVVALEPPAGQGPGIQSWRDLGAWYLGLARDRRDSTPEIRRKVAELTASASTPLEKMRALAEFVQGEIRYVAIELDIGGQQPHPASEVFSHRYGDCKDKATLLSAMLKEIGIDSYYVFINTARGSVTAATPPNLAFNHAILAIALPSGGDPTAFPASMAHPKLGQILFFDPTDEFTPLGKLRGNLQANYGLLATPEGGELLALPRLPADSSGTKRMAKLTLDETGTLRGDVNEVLVGDVAAVQRYELRSAGGDSDQIKLVEAVVHASLPTFKIAKAGAANVHATGRPLEWSYSFEAQNYAKTSGDLLLVRPRVLGSKSSALLETKEPREHPVEFTGPRHDEDVFEIAIPVGYEVDELPPAVDVDEGFVSYRSKTEKVGRTLRYSRVFEIKELSVPVNKADKLKEFYRIIAGDERSSAILKRGST
jgi:transglutaminase-like putative cysteine protease